MTRCYEVIAWCTAKGQEHSGQLGFGQKAEKPWYEYFFTSSHMGGVKAYTDDVTEAARFSMTKLKILTD